VIECHYERAKECIAGRGNPLLFLKKVLGKRYRPGRFLELEHYIKDWLGANGNFVDKKILDYLQENYGYQPHKNPLLQEGESVYHDGK